MTNEEYGQIVSQKAKKSPLIKDCLNAFWIGGLICVLGQLLMNWFGSMGLGGFIETKRGMGYRI